MAGVSTAAIPLEETRNKPTLVTSLFPTRTALSLSRDLKQRCLVTSLFPTLFNIRSLEMMMEALITTALYLITTALYLNASLIRGASLPDCRETGMSKQREGGDSHSTAVDVTGSTEGEGEVEVEEEEYKPSLTQ